MNDSPETAPKRQVHVEITMEQFEQFAEIKRDLEAAKRDIEFLSDYQEKIWDLLGCTGDDPGVDEVLQRIQTLMATETVLVDLRDQFLKQRIAVERVRGLADGWVMVGEMNLKNNRSDQTLLASQTLLECGQGIQGCFDRPDVERQLAAAQAEIAGLKAELEKNTKQ